MGSGRSPQEPWNGGEPWSPKIGVLSVPSSWLRIDPLLLTVLLAPSSFFILQLQSPIRSRSDLPSRSTSVHSLSISLIVFYSTEPPRGPPTRRPVHLHLPSCPERPRTPAVRWRSAPWNPSPGTCRRKRVPVTLELALFQLGRDKQNQRILPTTPSRPLPSHLCVPRPTDLRSDACLSFSASARLHPPRDRPDLDPDRPSRPSPPTSIKSHPAPAPPTDSTSSPVLAHKPGSYPESRTSFRAGSLQGIAPVLLGRFAAHFELRRDEPQQQHHQRIPVQSRRHVFLSGQLRPADRPL